MQPPAPRYASGGNFKWPILRWTIDARCESVVLRYSQPAVLIVERPAISICYRHISVALCSSVRSSAGFGRQGPVPPAYVPGRCPPYQVDRVQIACSTIVCIGSAQKISWIAPAACKPATVKRDARVPSSLLVKAREGTAQNCFAYKPDFTRTSSSGISFKAEAVNRNESALLDNAAVRCCLA